MNAEALSERIKWLMKEMLFSSTAVQCLCFELRSFIELIFQ